MREGIAGLLENRTVVSDQQSCFFSHYLFAETSLLLTTSQNTGAKHIFWSTGCTHPIGVSHNLCRTVYFYRPASRIPNEIRPNEKISQNQDHGMKGTFLECLLVRRVPWPLGWLVLEFSKWYTHLLSFTKYQPHPSTKIIVSYDLCKKGAQRRVWFSGGERAMDLDRPWTLK